MNYYHFTYQFNAARPLDKVVDRPAWPLSTYFSSSTPRTRSAAVTSGFYENRYWVLLPEALHGRRLENDVIRQLVGRVAPTGAVSSESTLAA
jgi:hypothetical protein